jgi:hypothetical protein
MITQTLKSVKKNNNKGIIPMDYLKINYEELSALSGLPHLQQLLYLRGIKPYIDYRTGIVGVLRGISYQSLAEELYVEPHQGIKSGSPSKDQIRRAIKGLEKAGLLRIQSLEWKLVFQCLLITSHTPNQNKPALKQNEQLASENHQESSLVSRVVVDLPINPITSEMDKPAIPQSNNNYFIFLYQTFEKFWELYPLKKSKQKTWEQFQSLQPTDALISNIFASLEKQISAYDQQLAQCQWVPGWKFPANWLAQHCWEDDINTEIKLENNHANHQKRDAATRSVDLLWDSCKAGAEYATEDSNIFSIDGYRKANEAYS